MPHTTVTGRSLQWKWGLLAALVVATLSLYPQISLWSARGENWNGSSAVTQIDEVAYSAYVNALISGRPRRNDPYSGRDGDHSRSQSESLFSVQFVPAYAIAATARMVGMSTSTAFILLTIIAACGSSAAIFWLLKTITSDARMSAAGTVAVLCFGTLTSAHGGIRPLLGADVFDYFPFIRRYEPAAPFPVFFFFCVAVWKSSLGANRRCSLLWAGVAGLSFAVLVFSYFYLWTAALAWMCCFALLWTTARPKGWRTGALSFGTIVVISGAAFVPYVMLLSRRAETMDAVQGLVFSHAPDLFRVSEVVGLAVAAFLIYAVFIGKIDKGSPAALFALSFALTPVLIFNQQILTGRSLQPIHYEGCIANYLVLIALFIALKSATNFFDTADGAALTGRLFVIALTAVGWALIEVPLAVTSTADAVIVHDQSMPALGRLNEIEAQVEKESGVKSTGRVVLSTSLAIADFLPTVSSNAVLWAPHMGVFSGVSEAEGKERFYQYLYYIGFKEQDLAKALSENQFNVMAALFGYARAVPRLMADHKPITAEEVKAEVAGYSEYISTLTIERVTQPTLSYVIVPTKGAPDFSHLDKWYIRDAGEIVGDFTLHRVHLRPN